MRLKANTLRNERRAQQVDSLRLQSLNQIFNILDLLFFSKWAFDPHLPDSKGDRCIMFVVITAGHVSAPRTCSSQFYYLELNDCEDLSPPPPPPPVSDSTFILIGAWQVMQNGDGFEVIHWKFLTDTLAGRRTLEPRAAVRSLKIIRQNLAYPRRRLPVIFNVHLTVHKGGFDQELCCTPAVKHIRQVDIWLTRERDALEKEKSFFSITRWFWAKHGAQGCF